MGAEIGRGTPKVRAIRQRCGRHRTLDPGGDGTERLGSLNSEEQGSVAKQRHLPLAILDRRKRQTPLEDLGRPALAVLPAKRMRDREGIVRGWTGCLRWPAGDSLWTGQRGPNGRVRHGRTVPKQRQTTGASSPELSAEVAGAAQGSASADPRVWMQQPRTPGAERPEARERPGRCREGRRYPGSPRTRSEGRPGS